MEEWEQRKRIKALRILIKAALHQVEEHPDDPRTWRLAELALEKARDIKAVHQEWKVGQ